MNSLFITCSVQLKQNQTKTQDPFTPKEASKLVTQQNVDTDSDKVKKTLTLE